MSPCALVTGGTGFIGRYLVKELISSGWNVICLTRKSVVPAQSNITCLPFDLFSPQTIRLDQRIVEKVDAIFHLAALIPHSGINIPADSYIKANVLGTLALLELFRLQLRTIVLIYMSSLPVIGKPQNLPVTEEHVTQPEHPYLISKLAAELLCEHLRRAEKLGVVSLRPTSPYGAGMMEQTVLPTFVKAAIASKEITLYGSGQRVQNFVHVNDVVRACLLAATSGATGIYNVAGEESVSMRDLATMIISAVPNCGSKIIMSEIPDPQEDYRWDISLSLSRQALGYVPAVDLATGVSDYINFLSSGERPYQWWKET